MKTLTAKDGKYRFGCLIDLARAEPVVIGRPVVVVLAVEEFEQLKVIEAAGSSSPRPLHDDRSR
jgi:hypothetical protein